MKNKNEQGFSLVELLVVVIIIGIVAAIAIPNLLASRKAANEASAIQSLRTYHSAQVTYFATAGNSTNYGAATELLGAKLVDTTLGASPTTKSGYTLTLTKSTGNYCATAVPSPADAEANSYAVGTDGVIHKLKGAAPACEDGKVTTGEPLGKAPTT